MNSRVERSIDKLKDSINDPGGELDEKAIALMEQKPTEFKQYSDAVAHVLSIDEDLAHRYAASFGHNEKVSPRQARQFGMDDEGDDVVNDANGKRVDALARELQRQHPSWSYETCLGRVRESHPELYKRYAAEK
jgi:hypothetical protein